MISYEVTLDIDPTFAEGVETYMRQKHIPETFSTGCFQHIYFERASPRRFRSRYQALTQADIDREQLSGVFVSHEDILGV